MKVGKKLGEFFSKKDFNLFSVSLFRADGKLETPTITKKDNYFIFRNEIWENNKRVLSAEISFTPNQIKDCILSIFRDLGKKEYKRLCLSQADGIVFVDLWAK